MEALESRCERQVANTSCSLSTRRVGAVSFCVDTSKMWTLVQPRGTPKVQTGVYWT